MSLSSSRQHDLLQPKAIAFRPLKAQRPSLGLMSHDHQFACRAGWSCRILAREGGHYLALLTMD